MNVVDQATSHVERDQAVASRGGLTRWPHVVVLTFSSYNWVMAVVLSANVASLPRFFILMVAKDRANPAVGVKNGGHLI